MQQIERYGVIALVFLLVTIVAVSFWGDSKSPGFWSRLTGRGAKKEVSENPTANMIPPATSGERAIDSTLPLSRNEGTPNSFAGGTNYVPEWQSPQGGTPVNPWNGSPGTAVTPDPWSTTPYAPPEIAQQPRDLAPPTNHVTPRTPEAQPRATPALIQPVSGQHYVVQKGDSLIRIAARTLGNGSRWKEIQSLNGGLDPQRLQPGMKIVLPASAKPYKAGGTDAAPSKAPNSTPRASSSTGATYVVRSGDTLSRIAARMLGDGGRWRDLVAANPGLDPNRLLVGKKIVIPGARPAELASATPRTPSAAQADSGQRSDRPRVR
jgi:nucleoid-associated protein YgaU